MAAWDITSYIYSGKSLNVADFGSGLADLFIKPDGLKLYVVDNVADAVAEYSLSTAWDVSTATFTDSLSVASEESNPLGLFIGDNGLKLYVIGSSGDSVYEYNLSTAWDVSTGAFNQSFSVSAQDGTPTGLTFSPDGRKMFVSGAAGNDVNEYAISTAWDISTATFTDSFNVSAQASTPTGLCFGDNGLELYLVAFSNGNVYQYTLSTAFDVSTATYTNSLNISSQSNNPIGVIFRGNGENFYIADTNERIYQYKSIIIITATAAIAGTSTLAAIPAVISSIASIAGDGTLSGVGAAIQPAPSRAVDEASAGGTSAALSVSLNSAITQPANPSGNT